MLRALREIIRLKADDLHRVLARGRPSRIDHRGADREQDRVFHIDLAARVVVAHAQRPARRREDPDRHRRECAAGDRKSHRLTGGIVRDEQRGTGLPRLHAGNEVLAPGRARRGQETSHLERPRDLLEAEARIARGLQESPEDSSLLHARGEANLLERSYEAAITDMQQALDA